MNDPDKQVKCATCKHTSKKGCMIFKTSAAVWDNCLGGGENDGPMKKTFDSRTMLKKVIVPDGWNKPMPYSYVFWQSEELVLPDELFEI